MFRIPWTEHVKNEEDFIRGTTKKLMIDIRNRKILCQIIKKEGWKNLTLMGHIGGMGSKRIEEKVSSKEKEEVQNEKELLKTAKGWKL